MLEKFACLPSELDEEDAHELLLAWSILGIYYDFRNKRQK